MNDRNWALKANHSRAVSRALVSNHSRALSVVRTGK